MTMATLVVETFSTFHMVESMPRKDRWNIKLNIICQMGEGKGKEKLTISSSQKLIITISKKGQGINLVIALSHTGLLDSQLHKLTDNFFLFITQF